MKRIIVIGSPGSGKTYFSKKLKDKLLLPLYHIDLIFWNRDKTHVDNIKLAEELGKILSKKEWIIDGNYLYSLEQRIKESDTIFYLNYSLAVCLSGVKERIGKKRDDLPWIEEKLDEDFVKYIKDFHIYQKFEIEELLKKYSSKKIIIFNEREDSIKFLKKELNFKENDI